ncbi:MAG TPA: hypothetical protein VGK37_16035 [Casimicrobiaceae bacterium]|jgi:hypothetical protein
MGRRILRALRTIRRGKAADSLSMKKAIEEAMKKLDNSHGGSS